MKNCKRRKLYGVFLCMALFLVALTGCLNQEKKEAEPLERGVLKVGMNLSIPSICYLSQETSQPEGFEVEVARALAEEMGLKLEIIDTSEANLLKSLDGNVYDCVISGVGISEWNDIHYSHTGAYADISRVSEQTGWAPEFTDVAVFTRKNNQMVQKLDEKLEKLKRNGTLSDISEKCFERDIIIEE